MSEIALDSGGLGMMVDSSMSESFVVGARISTTVFGRQYCRSSEIVMLGLR